MYRNLPARTAHKHHTPHLHWPVHQSGYDEFLQLHAHSIFGIQCSKYSAASINKWRARRMYSPPPQLVHASSWRIKCSASGKIWIPAVQVLAWPRYDIFHSHVPSVALKGPKRTSEFLTRLHEETHHLFSLGIQHENTLLQKNTRELRIWNC